MGIRNRDSRREQFQEIKNITITIPIYIITFTLCKSQYKLF